MTPGGANHSGFVHFENLVGAVAVEQRLIFLRDNTPRMWLDAPGAMSSTVSCRWRNHCCPTLAMFALDSLVLWNRMLRDGSYMAQLQRSGRKTC